MPHEIKVSTCCLFPSRQNISEAEAAVLQAKLNYIFYWNQKVVAESKHLDQITLISSVQIPMCYR